MAIHQISVFLENQAGQLAEITALLAKNNIDLRAINIAETSDYGVLRLIASHEPEACRVLRENGFIFSASEVVAVGVPDEPGGLSRLLQLLAERQIDVQYMYSIFGQPNGMAYMILRVAVRQKSRRCCTRTECSLPVRQSSALFHQIRKGRNKRCRK